VTDPYAAVEPAEPVRASTSVFSPAFAAVLVAVVIAGAGLFIGWLWADLAPRVPVIKVDNGFIYAEAEPEQAVAADGWFALLGAGAGLIFAILVWQLRRFRGVAMVIGLAVGSLLGAYLAWWIGYRIGMSEFATAKAAAKVGDHLSAPLNLRITDLTAAHWWPPKITGVAAVQALIAVITYTVLAGFSAYSNLRGYEAPVAVPPADGAALGEAPADEPPPEQRWTQFGPGFTGNSDSATGTART
jgi:Protein of unknown function (DUF2567)